MEHFGSLAYLSDDIVPVLDSLLVSTNLSDGERDTLSQARDLFSLVAGADAIVLGTTVGRMLDDKLLDGLYVIPMPRASSRLEEYAAEYSALLQAAQALHERLGLGRRQAA